MSISRSIMWIAVVAIGFSPIAASADTYTVLGTSDIFLAGQTSLPSPDFPGNPGATGPGAGSLPVAISVYAGEVLDITATGTVSCCLGGSPTNGPDGGGLGGGTSISGFGNVGAYVSGVQMALLGVFGGAITTPWMAFQIGSSDLDIVVPAGATTLYLGFADANGFNSANDANNGPGWYNDNTGSLTVNVTPLPAALPLFAGGLGALGLLGWRRKRTGRSVAV
jgi:hypothetical protein